MRSDLPSGIGSRSSPRQIDFHADIALADARQIGAAHAGSRSLVRRSSARFFMRSGSVAPTTRRCRRKSE
jgi:hypothetical protein